jgi:hypothetical protein
MEAEEMNGTEEPVKLQLDKETCDRLRKRAAERGVTPGDIIREAFDQFVEDNTEKS